MICVKMASDCNNTDNPDSPIKLTVFNGTTSIWNSKDWRKLRRHRIAGSKIGNIALQPYQIKENGLPILLTKNETSLLLEKKLAIIVECPPFLQKPRVEEREIWQAHREASFSEQVDELMELRKQEIFQKTDIIFKGKVAKRQKMDSSYSENTEEREKIVADEIEKISRPSNVFLLVQTPTEDPWLSSCYQPAKWNHPSTDTEELEYRTFRALWEMGHWVTPGGKFGGDFLVYPGDPVLYHARFIVHLTTMDAPLSPLDIIAYARLANSTGKTAALAYLDDVANAIQFQSLSWNESK